MNNFEEMNLPAHDYKKKIIVAVVVIAAIVAIAYFSKSKYLYKNPKADEVNVLDYKVNNLDYIVSDANSDRDGDGLEKWRENLLGSDPLSSNNLNINESATKTVYDNKGIAIKASDTASGVSNSNLTDQVAISLYASANALRNNGDTSTSSMAAVSDAIASQALTKKTPTIDETKIKIVADNSKESLKAYANAVFGYVIVYYPKVDEAAVLNVYYKNNDKTVLVDLGANVKLLDIMLSEIYKVKVPSDVYPIHKDLITYIMSAIEIEKSLIKADTDVLNAMIAFKELRTMKTSNDALIKKYRDFYDKKNIVFGPKDAGSILNSQ